jgi:hypothetical protein
MSNDVTKALARPTWAGELSDQEWLFVEAYLDSLKATQAGRAAGFATPPSRIDKTAPLARF